MGLISWLKRITAKRCDYCSAPATGCFGFFIMYEYQQVRWCDAHAWSDDDMLFIQGGMTHEQEVAYLAKEIDDAYQTLRDHD